ncbi:DNA-binding protein WhiA [soil metagenome]
MFTTEVREELAHLSTGRECCREAETAALLRIGGTLELRGGRSWGDVELVVATDSGAVARRLHASLLALGGDRPDVEAHAPHGLRTATRYRVRLAGATALLGRLGMLDAWGSLTREPPGALTARACDAAGYLRGALMAAGSISDPRRPPHLEVTAEDKPAARHVAGMLRRVGASRARPAEHGDRWRVVVKSGEQIGAILARVGAHGAFLRWDDARFRRELRGAANRAANADRANLTRVVAASARQTAGIERVVGAVGWDALPDELAEVALARLANPEASLAELGGLLDPPAGKATVHRRLERILTFGG